MDVMREQHLTKEEVRGGQGFSIWAEFHVTAFESMLKKWEHKLS